MRGEILGGGSVGALTPTVRYIPGPQGVQGVSVEEAVINGDGDLIITTLDPATGQTEDINAGHTVGPQGDPGEPGEQGEQGEAGPAGADGSDGYSPTVTVEEITGGHRVTITDEDGPHSFDVMDGQGGGGGAVSSVNGQTGAVVLDYADVGADAEGTAAAAVAPIEELIPEQAASDNQLADKAFVNSSIENVAAYYITKDAAGNPFATKAELLAATVFYSGGAVRTPTRNDYCVVLADESKTISETGENPTTRYLYGNGAWDYQYIVNNSGLTAAQWAAVNSNITEAAVTKLNGIAAGADMLKSAYDSDNAVAQAGGIAAYLAAHAAGGIFWVNYGTTTFAQITAALADGKLPVCIYNDVCYVYFGLSNDYHCFSSVLTDSARRLYVKSSWGSASFTMEKTSNKVTSLSASSTDTQYPSAKCVYDLVGDIESAINTIRGVSA